MDSSYNRDRDRDRGRDRDFQRGRLDRTRDDENSRREQHGRERSRSRSERKSHKHRSKSEKKEKREKKEKKEKKDRSHKRKHGGRKDNVETSPIHAPLLPESHADEMAHATSASDAPQAVSVKPLASPSDMLSMDYASDVGKQLNGGHVDSDLALPKDILALNEREREKKERQKRQVEEQRRVAAEAVSASSVTEIFDNDASSLKLPIINAAKEDSSVDVLPPAGTSAKASEWEAEEAKSLPIPKEDLKASRPSTIFTLKKTSNFLKPSTAKARFHPPPPAHENSGVHPDKGDGVCIDAEVPVVKDEDDDEQIPPPPPPPPPAAQRVVHHPLSTHPMPLRPPIPPPLPPPDPYLFGLWLANHGNQGQTQHPPPFFPYGNPWQPPPPY